MLPARNKRDLTDTEFPEGAKQGSSLSGAEQG